MHRALDVGLREDLNGDLSQVESFFAGSVEETLDPVWAKVLVVRLALVEQKALLPGSYDVAGEATLFFFFDFDGAAGPDSP